MSIWGLWESQTEAIIYVRFRDACAETWKTEEVGKLWPGWGEIKREKYGQHCHD